MVRCVLKRKASSSVIPDVGRIVQFFNSMRLKVETLNYPRQCERHISQMRQGTLS